MKKLAVVAIVLAGVLLNHPLTVAAPLTSFEGALQPMTPASGWSYLWNSSGVIGDPTNYSALLPTSDPIWFYDNDGVDGIPGSEPGAYVYVGLIDPILLDGGQPGAHPGRGSEDIGSGSIERFVIAAFTLQTSGNTSITNSLLTNVDHSSDGVHVQVYLNSNPTPLIESTTPSGQGISTAFDVTLGNLSAGDVIYVAIGPGNTDFSDTVGLRYTIDQTTSIPEPSSWALLTTGLLGVLGHFWQRRQRRRSQRRTTLPRLILSALPFITLAVFTVPVHADFIFPDFSDTSGLNLVGSAAQVGQRLRLTPDSGDQAGAAWFVTKQSVGSGFQTTFQFQISHDGADGIAFVIQNTDVAALGGPGGGLGYHSIPNSLAVEFDTWLNPVGDFPSGLGDPSENHISVHTRGLLPNGADPLFSLGSTAAIPEMSDGNLHTVKISYTPGILQIFLDNIIQPALVAELNLATILDLEDDLAWVGLTAGTGGVSEEHDIRSWSFGPRLVSEPGTLLLLSGGLLVLFVTQQPWKVSRFNR